MGRTSHRALAALILAGLAVAGCGASEHESATAPAVRTFAIRGTPFKRIALSPSAAARIGLRTAPAARRPGTGGAGEVAVPYDAVVYDPNGVASVYTSPRPRIFIRHPVQIDHIAGSTAILRRGPTPGEAVVTVGAGELFGVETGVQGEEK
jgi:hypothetical protein